MAKGMTKTAVKRKLKTMVTVTKQLLDDRMTNPRTHVNYGTKGSTCIKRQVYD